MDDVKKKSQRKKQRIPSAPSDACLDANAVFLRNRIFENAALDSFLIRFPGLFLRAHFYYRLIEDRKHTVSHHDHRQWEIVRVCSGDAEYFITDAGFSVKPGNTHYLVIPPGIKHGWNAHAAPLLMHSWQVEIAAEDIKGQQILESLRESVIATGFMVKASPAQIQTETILWQMSGEACSAQVFGPVLSGIARIVIGDLITQVNPWPASLRESGNEQQIALNRLTESMKVFLDENLCRMVTLSDMESHFHFNGRYLNCIFKERYHCSIDHYLRDQRIELSKRWLTTTSRALKDIALSLGYSVSVFCRYFLEHTGQTPSAYRQNAFSANNAKVSQSIQNPNR